MDTTSSRALADSLDLAVKEDNPYFNTMMRILTTRCMMQAVYFSGGTVPQADFLHYGLASPIYTHFTSPIRRYADVIVHRHLAVMIGADSSYSDLLDKHKVQQLCNNLNFRHKQAQYAQRASIGLHTHLFLKGRVEELDAYVLFVRQNALQFLVPKYGFETVFLLKEYTCSFDDKNAMLTVEGYKVRMFDKVKVRLSVDTRDAQHVKLKVELLDPPVSCSKNIEPVAKKPKTSF